MKEYHIAVIPGDGIGMEVVPEGVKALQAAQKIVGGFELRFEEFPWGTEFYLKTGKMMPPDALEDFGKVRCDLSRRSGNAGARAGQHHTLGFAPADSQKFSAVYQPAPDSIVARVARTAQRQGTGRHQLCLRARKFGRRIFRRGWARAHRYRTRSRHSNECLYAPRRRACDAIQFRVRAPSSKEKVDERYQIECVPVLDGLLG